ncbi:GntR family transcriptional regulator [Microbacterium xanthum]|uniref:GntR family transcriptional regulator n=1 Tax=Microbacterium xanthum TaxID=3079794 RepID=UPI002AD38580|nr:MULTISPECIES: GntR family transcriptional regulator [unclassified Microbacterium]MDZ8172061.1 GntR family transcriptional regulator [Microbacterium sp. KSW-48]MDZ8202232.1 GntR family transcriptional regulator [Microbacterium sp. SSW1-59]
MLIRVDPSQDVPLWEQVAASVRLGIATGSIHAGDRLPSARDVAASLDLNLHTVLRAYQELRDEGLVDMRRGRGAVVTAAAGALPRLRDDVVALAERARELGLAPGVLASLLADVDPAVRAAVPTDGPSMRGKGSS